MQVNVGGFMRGMKALAEAGLEGYDIVEALHDALPRHLRAPRNARPVEKMKALWRNFDRVDINEGFCNVVNNQLEDAVFGAVGQLSGRPIAEALGGSPLGGTTLLNSRRRGTLDMWAEQAGLIESEERWHPAMPLYEAFRICKDAPVRREAARRERPRRRGRELLRRHS